MGPYQLLSRECSREETSPSTQRWFQGMVTVVGLVEGEVESEGGNA